MLGLELASPVGVEGVEVGGRGAELAVGGDIGGEFDDGGDGLLVGIGVQAGLVLAVPFEELRVEQRVLGGDLAGGGAGGAGADPGAFEDGDGDAGALEQKCGGEPGDAGADDDDIGGHVGLEGRERGPVAGDVPDRLAGGHRCVSCQRYGVRRARAMAPSEPATMVAVAARALRWWRRSRMRRSAPRSPSR